MPDELLTNEELMARLRSHNYPVPPVTPSTRGVLLKKLAQLDAEKKKNRARSAVNGQQKRGAALLDYSSGEEDVTSSTSATPYGGGVRRRTSNTARGVRSNGHGAVVASRLPPVVPPSKLSNFSENEDDDDDEDQEDDAVEDEDEEEEDDDEVDEEDDEEDETEPPRNDFRQRHLGIQTSPRLDDTSLIDGRSNGSIGGKTSTPNTDLGMSTSRFGLRFQSSTPILPIPSTSSFMPTPNSRPPALSSNMTPSSSSSTLRKAIAKNEKAFGSLGEVLDSMPTRTNVASNVVTSVANNGGSKVDTKPASKESKTDYLNKNSGFCNSHFISKLVIGIVVAFFIFLFYKYSTLRPQIDVRDRLPVCSELAQDGCISERHLQAASNIYRSMVELLENNQACPMASEGDGDVAEIGSGGLTVSELKKSLVSENLDEGEADHLSTFILDELLSRLITILDEMTDVFGIRVQHGADENLTELALVQPRVQWSCWIMQKFNLMYTYGTLLTWWALVAAGIGFAVYALYRAYVWNQERIVREKQDVFELVEQVLSLLANQHQAAMRGGVVARPYLAINHIRDQLIPPQDRKRKQKLWAKVVNYIRESESRVREEVQTVYGEENRVWRWIPDMTWGAPINPHGPNPFVISPTTSAAVFPPPPVPAFVTPAQSPPMPPTSSPSSAWQGPAFSSLNKNVAAPAVAPTGCLKVRHMFDRQTMLARYPPGRSSQTAWMWQVKEEILQRCSSCSIVHIAVDSESNEGCVYIKAKSNDEAAKVFGALHGQWYAGNLVTVKYMKEERYHERFPDSRHQQTPLRPSKMKAI